MPINLNLKVEKKHLYLLSAIMIFLVGVGVVIAYNTGPPNVHGHDAVEIANLPTGGSVSFGAPVDKNPAQIYGPTATDGFVIGYVSPLGDYRVAYGYTGSSASSLSILTAHGEGHYPQKFNIIFPVRKGEYWKVEVLVQSTPANGEVSSLKWIPLQ